MAEVSPQRVFSPGEDLSFMTGFKWAFCAWVIGKNTEQHPAGTALGAAYEDRGKTRCTMQQPTAETEQHGRGGCFSTEEMIPLIALKSSRQI